MERSNDAKAPNRSSDMTLVKDMQEDRIVYYWTDTSNQKLSPLLASITLADEWRLQYLNDNYEWQQRRSSGIDRRRHQTERDMYQGRGNVSPLFNIGRRATDKQAKVAKDLATEKLQALRAAYESAEKVKRSKK